MYYFPKSDKIDCASYRKQPQPIVVLEVPAQLLSYVGQKVRRGAIVNAWLLAEEDAGNTNNRTSFKYIVSKDMNCYPDQSGGKALQYGTLFA